MASLQGSQMKVTGKIASTATLVTLGLVQSLSGQAATNATEEKGIGGYVRNRLTNYDYNVSVGGLVTDYKTLNLAAITTGTGSNAGLPPVLTLYLHDLTLNSARIGNITISGGSDAPLEYSMDGKFLSMTTGATPSATVPTPGTFFVFSDGTIHWGTESDTITGFSITKSQDISLIYGSGSMDPTEMQIATAAYEGQFVLSASAMSKIASGAWDPAASTIDFHVTFVDPTSASRIVNIKGDNAAINDASGSVDPDSALEVTQSFKFETLTITNTTA